jgi:hypothetical protein
MDNPAQDERLFEIMFKQLVLSLTEAAMMQMGKIVNPGTGKAERNLAQARGTIDLLRMLKAKVQKGLSESEAGLLDQNLLHVQMNYVSESEEHPEESLQADQAAAAAVTDEEEETAEAAAEEPKPETPLPGEEELPGHRPGQNN